MTAEVKKEPEIPEGLEDVPRDDSGIELEGKEKSAYDVIGGVLGLQEPDIYSVIERSEFEEDEIAMFGQLIQYATHGIGSPASLDRPMVWLGERIIKEVRLRRSKNRQSSGEFERIMASWINYLRQKEDERQRSSQKNVGTS